MKRHHPAVYAEIPISQHIAKQLSHASVRSFFEKEDWEIVAEEVEEWVWRHHPDALPKPANSGYQWKHLFLPDGTLLRTVFNGKNHHGLVEGDAILYEGQAISPSGFANALGGIRRNAWTSIWIRFPNTSEWKRADTLRPRKQSQRERRPHVAAQPAPPPTPLAPLTAPAAAAATAAAAARQDHHALAAHEVRQPQRTVDAGTPETCPNLAAPHARGIQRVGRFRGRASRIAGPPPKRAPVSIDDVVDALRRAEARQTIALPTQKGKPGRLFVAWFSSDEGFPVPASRRTRAIPA
ncbi:hypothetical protein [Massilia glaciei]|uniref:hypothetical protein n=1 Tax=Massilia glaciei TaxID=1524097 RepID=UPI0011B22EB3|nr:hypothetical protein [Massilia glaciei]